MERRRGCSIPDAGLRAKVFPPHRSNSFGTISRPDMIYFDDTNAAAARHERMKSAWRWPRILQFQHPWHGRNEAVMNAKHLNPEQRKALLVYDIERGTGDGYFCAEPWQTDTCIARLALGTAGYSTSTNIIRAQSVPTAWRTS